MDGWVDNRISRWTDDKQMMDGWVGGQIVDEQTDDKKIDNRYRYIDTYTNAR